MKSTVRIAAASGMVAVFAGVVGAGSAQAQSVSRTLLYSCNLSVVHVPVKGVVHAEVPDGAVAGRATGTSTISVGTTLDAQYVDVLRTLEVASVETTLETGIEVTGAGGTRSIPLRLTAPELRLPSSGSMRVTASGTVPGQTFGTPGTVSLHAGDFTLHATAVKTDGEKIRNVNVSCALKTEHDVLASVQVQAAGSGTSSTDPSSAGHRQTAGADLGGDELADTGQSTAWLIPVSAGTAAAGAAAVGTVWLRRRRSGQHT
ncbi:hypothetical protein GCM10018793_67440 [Streptomyces sulfonofaciens]|uniref:DUF6801 domain-containing protein n=1 Tax=Streptomyces sulfonofaciens TaxID=68272 RepID=A0A919L9E3_9ACTN|nr:DUF6801 domain-containing protein [Streptomyces sulfonofaciens]GHH88284.1 hypothetical protein GCM10018793_67440 [Streptomyces sulfonofaciens]